MEKRSKKGIEAPFKKPRPSGRGVRHLERNGKVFILFLVFLILIDLYYFKNYLSTNYLPAGIDYNPFISRLKYYSENNNLYVWVDFSIGHIESLRLDNFISFLPILDPISTVKLFIILSSMIGSISMYLLSYRFTMNSIISFISTFIYIGNQFIFSQIASGHIYVVAYYYFLPLLILTYINLIEDKDIKICKIFIFVLIFVSIIVLTRYEAIFSYSLILLLITLLYLEKQYKKYIINFSIISVLLVGVGALFFLPLIKDISSTYLKEGFKYPIDMVKYWSLNAYNTFLGYPGERSYFYWIYNLTPDKHPLLAGILYKLIMSIFPIFAIASLLINRDRKLKVIFGFLFIISIFWAKGTYEPLSGVFEWLWDNVPYFSSLRVTNRVLTIYYFAGALLIALLLRDIYPRKKLFTILATVLLVYPILTLYPVNVEGFLVWKPNEEFIQPYKIISNKTGEMERVYVIPNQHVINTTIYSSINTGWRGYDIGSVSNIWHGKPVVNQISWNPYGNIYQKYILGIITYELTDDITKILGLVNVKYIILNKYPEDKTNLAFRNKDYGTLIFDRYQQHKFLYRQKGITSIFKNNVSEVFINANYLPLIFASENINLALSGREILVDLAELPYYHFNHSAIYFADQIIRESGKQSFYKLYNLSSSMLISNSELTDLAMLLINDSKSIRIIPAKYAYPSINASKYWISSDYAIKKGLFAYNSRTLYTTGENMIEIPFDIKDDNHYEVWVRVLYGKNRGKLIIKTDNNTNEFIPYNDFETFKWTKIGEIYLNKGKHKLVIQNKRSKYGVANYIDEIQIIKKGHMDKYLKEAEKLIDNFNGHIIMFFDNNKMVLKDVSSKKTIINERLLPFWNILDKKSTKYEFIANAPNGYNYSLMINLRGERKYYTIMDFISNEMLDWSNYTGFYIWFNGQGTGNTFFINIYFNKSYDNWAKYVFIDDYNGWKKITFYKSDYTSKKGNIDWSKVWRIGIGSDNKKLTGRYYIGTLNTFSREKRELKIYVPRTDNYKMSLQVEGHGNISILVNNETINIFADKEWNELEEIFKMKKGVNKILLSQESNLKIKRVVIYSIRNNETLREMLTKNKTTTVTYKKINPTKYIAHVKTDTPIFLIFSESYHPLWQAYIDDKEYDSIIAYSFINSFYIPKTGEYNITIEFIGQKYVWVGLTISIMTVIILISYIIIGDRVSKSFKLDGKNI